MFVKMQRFIEVLSLAVVAYIIYRVEMKQDYLEESLTSRLITVFMLLNYLWLYAEVAHLRKQQNKKRTIEREARTVVVSTDPD